jgi:protoporphyrinogen oxidase
LAKFNFCPLGDFFKPCPSRAKAGFKKSPIIITKEVIMQTKVNSVAIRATNATGAGKTSTLKMGDKIIVTVTLSETVVVNPMALPVVSLMLPAFKDKAVVVAVMPVVAVSPLAITRH